MREGGITGEARGFAVPAGERGEQGEQGGHRAQGAQGRGLTVRRGQCRRLREAAQWARSAPSRKRGAEQRWGYGELRGHSATVLLGSALLDGGARGLQGREGRATTQGKGRLPGPGPGRGAGAGAGAGAGDSWGPSDVRRAAQRKPFGAKMRELLSASRGAPENHHQLGAAPVSGMVFVSGRGKGRGVSLGPWPLAPGQARPSAEGLEGGGSEAPRQDRLSRFLPLKATRELTWLRSTSDVAQA